MRKIVTFVLSLLICFNALSAVSAKSVEPVDKSGQIVNNGYSFEIDYEGEKGLVVYGPNGIDIILSGRQVHLDTTFEVKKLIAVNDINGDDYVDFFAYENASEFTDQVFTIDGKNGAVIASTRYTHENYSSTFGKTQENSYVLKMALMGSNVLMIVDYCLILVDPLTCETLACYTAEDNIWDFEIFNGYIGLTDQGGYFTVLYDDLHLAYGKQIAKPYDVQYAYYDPDWSNYIERIQAGMSAFDVWKNENESNIAYVTTQDGCLWCFDLNNSDDSELFVSKIRTTDDEAFENSISYEYDTVKKIDGISYGIKGGAGLFSENYMNYKVVDGNENYILIGCGFGDEEMLSGNGGMGYDYYSAGGSNEQHFVVYEKETSSSIVVSPAENTNCIDAKLISYNDKQAVLISSVSSGELHLFIYDFEGNVLYQKTLIMGVASGNQRIRLSTLEDGYMVEVLQEGIAKINSKLDTLTEIYKKTSSKLVESDKEGYTLVYAENGKNNKLEHYDTTGNVIWTYTLLNDGNYRGMEGLLVEDFNYDGVPDYIFAAVNYDKDNQPTWARYTVISGTNGSVMRNGTIQSDSYYDENGRKVIVWLNSNNIKLVSDWDRDGCKELIIGGRTISSRNFACKGDAGVDIYDEGSLLEIGDVNSDGVEDYLLFAPNNKLATMYCSSISDYNVSYRKQNKSIALNPKGENSYKATTLGDINNDGAKEILINNYNTNNYQIVDVYDGKSLTKLYTLYENGVSDYEILMVSDLDLNEDGWNELIGTTGSYWCGELFDGKTGELMFYFPFYEDSFFTTEGEYYHPDYLIDVITDKESQELIPMDAGDINNDGIHDLMYTTTEYNYFDYTSDSVLVLRSGKDYELIEKVTLPSSQTNYAGVLANVRNSEEILAIKYDSVTSLVTKSGELIADYKLKANEFIYVDEKTVLAITDSCVYRLNTEDSFTITSELPSETNDYQLHLSWQPLVDYSVMKIYDNGNLVYYGSDCETTISLLQGEHRITLSLSDGDGKSSNASYKIKIAKQKNSFVWMVGLAAILFGGAAVVALYRKIYIKKKNAVVKAAKEVNE